MIRTSVRPLLVLALAAFLTTGCGDGGTDPGTIEFDPNEVGLAFDAAFAPTEASGDATFVLTSFFESALGGQGAGAGAHRVLSRVRDPNVQALVRQTASAAGVDIPPAMRGKTFIYDPNVFAWEPDETRAGAPANGLRVIWYAINETGAIEEPLEELGYIDVTDEGDGALQPIGVVIVRGADQATLADYTYGYASTDDGTAWTEMAEFSGTFSDGTAAADVEIALDGAGEWGAAETFTLDLSLAGPDASYTYGLDGEYESDGVTFTTTLVSTIESGGVATVLNLETEGNDALEEDEGTGTLTHGGTLVANVVTTDQGYAMSKPDGGSFTAGEENDLGFLVLTMVLYGPLFMLTLLGGI